MDADTSASALVDLMFEGGGFSAKEIAVGADIFARMVKDDDAGVLLSFPAALMATGVRGVLTDIVRRKLVDGVITTCGTLDHDLARLFSHYYQGDFALDDATLHRQGINRLGSVLVPNESYGIVLEERLRPLLKTLHAEKNEWSGVELIRRVGTEIASEKRAKESLLYWAARNGIPVFVPGITDGAFGSQLWLHRQMNRSFRVDILADEDALDALVHEKKRLGAVMLGGGISKHHTIWWAQFVGGLEYAVYVTTAVEHDGSLSGARLKEAISWGKLREKARHVTIDGDATVIFPLLYASTLAKLEKAKGGTKKR